MIFIVIKTHFCVLQNSSLVIRTIAWLENRSIILPFLKPILQQHSIFLDHSFLLFSLYF